MQLTEELFNQLNTVEAEYEGVDPNQVCQQDYSRTNLLGVLDRVRPRDNFVRNVLYNREMPLTAENAELDVLYEDHIMPAPFVKPCDPARLIDNRRKFGTVKAKPSYIKAMDKIEYCTPPKRYAGWRPWSSLSTAERKRREYEDKVRMLELSAQMSETQMIWQQLRTGKMTYSAIDVDGTTPIAKYEMDFKRNPILGKFKFKWDKEAECIGQDLQSVYDTVECEGGAPITIMLAGHKACAALRWNKDFRDSVKCARESGYLPLADIDLDFTPRSGRRVGQTSFEGQIGNVDLWCSKEHYTCPKTGKKKNYLGDNEILFIGRSNDDFDAGFTRMYGEIMICDVFVPMERHIESWKERNPSKEYIKLESAPLPMMWNANSTALATIDC